MRIGASRNSGKVDITKHLFVMKGKKYALMTSKGIMVVHPDCIWKPLLWRINKKVEHAREIRGSKSRLIIKDDFYGY